MPIYEYECSECNHYFDELQKMNDDPLLDCPVCNKPRLKRLLSAPSFRLKGSGWYETDFKKNINNHEITTIKVDAGTYVASLTLGNDDDVLITVTVSYTHLTLPTILLV